MNIPDKVEKKTTEKIIQDKKITAKPKMENSMKPKNVPMGGGQATLFSFMSKK